MLQYITLAVASRKAKQAMSDFVHYQLDSSGLYSLQQDIDHIMATPHAEGVLSVYVALHSSRTPLKKQNQVVAQNRSNGIRTADVFYNNDVLYVRMMETEASRKDKSLKNYTLPEINRIVKLSGLEKQVMDQQGKRLVYYQPESAVFSESMRWFDMDPVILDYSHVRPDEQAYDFVETRPSVDYKLPKDYFQKKEPLDVMLLEK